MTKSAEDFEQETTSFTQSNPYSGECNTWWSADLFPSISASDVVAAGMKVAELKAVLKERNLQVRGSSLSSDRMLDVLWEFLVDIGQEAGLDCSSAER